MAFLRHSTEQVKVNASRTQPSDAGERDLSALCIRTVQFVTLHAPENPLKEQQLRVMTSGEEQMGVGLVLNPRQRPANDGVMCLCGEPLLLNLKSITTICITKLNIWRTAVAEDGDQRWSGRITQPEGSRLKTTVCRSWRDSLSPPGEQPCEEKRRVAVGHRDAQR